MALGATRGRIASQLLSESLLLAMAGGALGFLLSWGAISLLAKWGPANIPRLADARLDWRLFLFALGVSAATGLLFGVAPAVQGSDTRLHSALMADGRGRTAARSARLLRNGLVASEVALAVLVMIGATLLIPQLRSPAPPWTWVFNRRACRPCDCRWRELGMRPPIVGSPFCSRPRNASRRCLVFAR